MPSPRVKIPALTDADKERFWSLVKMPDDGCWEWQGNRGERDYGRFGIGNGVYASHRLSFFINYGVDPGDRLVCHHCDNPPCVNPAHLFLGSNLDNSNDRIAKGRGFHEPATKLHPHRRHVAGCEHKSKGWNYTLCGCPIWCDGALSGKRFRRSLDTTNWERALRRVSRLERGEEQDFLEPAQSQTLESAVKAYLSDAKVRNLKPSSLRTMKSTLDQFAAVTSAPLEGITSGDISKFRERREMKPRTQRKELEHLRAFFAFCVSRKLTEDNPAKGVRPPRVDDEPVQPYTREETDKLLAACDQMGAMYEHALAYVRRRTRALILALLYSGLRVSDVAALKRSRLEKTNHLVLRTTKSNVPVKVLLPAPVAEALRGLPAPMGNTAYFFWSGNGDVSDCAKSLWRTVSRLGKIAGVHAHPHRFRHTFAVELLTKGASIETVQRLLGHQSVKTTERHYAHFVAAHQALLDSAVSLLDFTPDARPLLVSPSKKRLRNS